MSDVKTTPDPKTFVFTDEERKLITSAIAHCVNGPYPDDAHIAKLVDQIQEILKPSFDQTLE